MSPRTITTSATPLVSDEQIEQARARKIVTIAEDGGLDLKHVKKEYWALCCFHEENTPSLAFNPEKNVFYCHGCEKGGDVIDFVMARDALNFPEAVLKLADEPQPTTAKPPLGPIVAEYLYPGADGVARHRVTKHDPKDFRPWHRAPNDSWQIGEGAEKLPLYRLPELQAADPAAWVLIVEGEKDVDRLAELGFVATTNAGGAGKWRPELSEYVRGRRVCIIPDNDDAGERHAEKVARSLVGISTDIRILRLPNLPAKGDVSDYLDG
jgi:putative DNA primase/helicase